MQLYKNKTTTNTSGAGPKAILLFILLFSATSSVHAVTLGLPQSTAKIGYSAALAYVSVDDPDGDTESAMGTQPIGLVYTDWLFGDFRYWAEAFYYSVALDASTDKVGQDVERAGLRFSIQKSFRVVESWAPWLGVGLDVSQAQYSLRHTKDDEGFLIQEYSDRDEVAASLLFNLISEWSMVRDWSVAIKLEQSIPLSGDVSEFLVSGALLYRY